MHAILNLALISAVTCSPYVTQMSVEEKVGQLFMVHFNGKEANSDARILIEEAHVGGFIYYNWSNGLESPDQVKNLSASLQKIASKSGLPHLIAADQEGGRVARLKPECGFIASPGNGSLAAAGDVKAIKELSYQMAHEMSRCGVNVNLAPVVDINSNPDNIVIGTRSFGPNAELVTQFAEAAIDGFHEGGVLTTLKHFPGHGDTKADSHLALPIIEKSLEELQKVELVPFQKLAPKTDLIMTAHIQLPKLDPRKDSCATISKPIITGLLREKMGFNGVVIADSMIMKGVLDACGGSIDQACLRAFDAGCDIILLGGKNLNDPDSELKVKDVQRITALFVQKVKSGEISEKRLNASLERIVALKEKIKKE